jgi:dihydroorotase
MSELLIKGGRVLNPASKFDQIADVHIKEGIVEQIRPRIRARQGMDVILAEGCFVLPGLIDMHTHLREPGHEYKESVRTGTEAAAAGGFTTILCMANTDPVNDNASVTRYIRNQVVREAVVHVYPIGAATEGLAGKKLAKIGEMFGQGIVAVSDDGHCVLNAQVMRKVMEYAKTFGLPVIAHAEDPNLTVQCGVNEGPVATQMGLQGTPNAAEAVMVARDCYLAGLTRAHLHVAHVSTAEALESIAMAKEKGWPVTCEVTPHHLALTDEKVLGFVSDSKVNPPLRSESDRRALLRALKSGLIDVIATDHAPHSSMEKDHSFECAAPGMIGLETALGVVWPLALKYQIEPLDLFAKMTVQPAQIVGLARKGRLEVSGDADVCIFDPVKEWHIDKQKLHSKSDNTPFAGMALKGRVKKTIVSGEVVYEG